jgi:hypothetical protein
MLYQAHGTDGLAPLDAAMELPDEVRAACDFDAFYLAHLRSNGSRRVLRIPRAAIHAGFPETRHPPRVFCVCQTPSPLPASRLLTASPR